MRPIIEHFTDTDLYKFTMCCAIVDNFPDAYVKYGFIDRSNQIYPKGFGEKVKEQIKYLEDLRITDEEVEYMKLKCPYIPRWFYTYLRGFRFNSNWVTVNQDSEGHLHIDFEGLWAETVLLEVMVLAIVSELFYIETGAADKFDYDAYYRKAYNKAVKMIKCGCKWADFGPRRRSSFKAEEVALKAMLDATRKESIAINFGRCVGTSNVYLAMKYNVTPIGTMAHEWISGIAGIYGPLMANQIAMEKWRHTYHGALGTFLYDTFGFDAFARNFNQDFAHSFSGLRVDSGDNFEQFGKICQLYSKLGIDAKEKNIVFSNALSADDACEIEMRLHDFAKISYGMGTSWTNDWEGIVDEAIPLTIVIKLLAIKLNSNYPFYSDTCKMSEDEGKHTGNASVVNLYKEILHK